MSVLGGVHLSITQRVCSRKRNLGAKVLLFSGMTKYLRFFFAIIFLFLVPPPLNKRVEIRDKRVEIREKRLEAIRE